MSISSEITRLSGNVSDALTAIANKGVTVPSGSNSDDLATLIAQITTGGTAAISIVDTTDSAGGTIRTVTALDISDTTATEADVLNSKYFYTAAGVKTQGTAVAGDDVLVVTLEWDSQDEMWKPDCAWADMDAAQQSGKTISVMADQSYGASVAADGYWDDDDYFEIVVYDWTASQPSEMFYAWTPNVYALVDSYPIINPYFESPTRTYTPTESQQTDTITYNVYDDYNGIEEVSVTVNAIPSSYVGSGITRRDSTSLSASGATVTAPAGYYASAATKSVASMTLPSTTESTSSGYTAGYILINSQVQYLNIPAGYNDTAQHYLISPAVTYYTGSTAPSSSLGSNGDIYLQTS